MKIKGNGFRYFIDGKEVLYKDLQTMIRLDMTVSVDGLNVYYSSPEEKDKPERSIYSKLEDFKISKKRNKTEDMHRLVEEELERQEKNDSKSTGDFLEIMINDWVNNLTGESKPSGILGIEDSAKIMTEGKKENSGKIDYSEIDFDILDLMANRFNANKHKYPHGNMLKPIEEKQLLFALLRHLKKMIQPVANDPETFEEHLASILCNAQMVYQQRKLKNNKLGYIK